jgi:hypothetical protein
MSYVIHNPIVVISNIEKYINKAHEKAKDIFGKYVTEIILSNINSCRSFMIPPDGSKEGWPESDEGDQRRDKFIEWIESQKYEDDSNSITYIEVDYNEKESTCNIKRVNNI